MGCLKSIGNRLVCEKCGSEHIFTDKGHFIRADGSAPAFADILSWSSWQKDRLHEYIESLGPADLIREDSGSGLFIVHPLHGKVLAAEGKLGLYKDRLEISSGEDVIWSRDIKSVKSMAVILVNTILFTEGEDYYELRLPARASALEYLISYYYLNGKEYKR